MVQNVDFIVRNVIVSWQKTHRASGAQTPSNAKEIHCKKEKKEMKKNTLSRIVALALALVMVFAMAACGSSDKPADEKPGEEGNAPAATEITLAMDGEPSSLNPYLMGGSKAANFMLHTAYAVLWRVEHDDSVTCDLAESYTIDWDNLVMTVKLREGLKFSDGSPLTAEDVVCSLKTSASDSGSNTAALDVNNTKAIDETTVQIGLSGVSCYSVMIDISCIGIISKEWTEDGTNAEKKAADVLCSGAYQLEPWSTGETMVYVKNPNYWNAENVTFEKITVKCIGDETTRFLEYQNGGADICYLTKSENVSAVDSGSVKSEMFMKPIQSVHGLAFDTENVENYKSENLRLAIAHAIDVKGLVEAYCGEYYTVAASIYPSTSPYFVDCALEYDVELAKQYLADYYAESGASSAEIILTAKSGDLGATLSEAIQYMVESVLDGVKVEVMVVDTATYFDMQAKGEQHGSIVPLAKGYFDPSKYMNAWMSTSSNSIMHMPTKELDDLLIRTVTDISVTAEERFDLLADLQKGLAGTGKFIPMFEEFVCYAHNDKVSDLSNCISTDGRMLQGLFLTELPGALVEG